MFSHANNNDDHNKSARDDLKMTYMFMKKQDYYLLFKVITKEWEMFQ